MSKKRRFPKNWCNLPESEILESIEYLLQHYQEYKIKMDMGGKRVQIGNVSIVRSCRNKGEFYIVNYACFPCSERGVDRIERLFYACKEEYRRRERIREDKNEKIQFHICIWIVVFWCGCVMFKVMDEINSNKKAKEIDKAVKQYEKTLPYYNEYKQTQSQIASYRDSLWCASK